MIVKKEKKHLNTAFYTAHVLHTYGKTPSEHCILHRPRFTHVRQNTIWTLHSTPPTFYTRTSKHHLNTAFYTAHVLHTYVKTPSEHCILHRPRFTHVRQNTIFRLPANLLNITTLLQGDPNISNNMNSLIFKAAQDFITQSGRFAMEWKTQLNSYW